MAASPPPLPFEETPVDFGRQSSIGSLLGTPAPVAASTVMRKHERVQVEQGVGALGSFLDNVDGEAGSVPSLVDVGLSSTLCASNNPGNRPHQQSHIRCRQLLAESRRLFGLSNRSSLGLVDVDQMTDLSSSILHLQGSSPAAAAAATKCTPAAQSSKNSFLADEPVPPVDVVHRAEPCSSSMHATVSGGLELGAVAQLLFNSTTEADQNESVDEIQFDQQDLEQFNEDFSSLGDTMTEDPELNGDVEAIQGMVPKAGDIADDNPETARPCTIGQSELGPALEEDVDSEEVELSECDMVHTEDTRGCYVATVHNADILDMGERTNPEGEEFSRLLHTQFLQPSAVPGFTQTRSQVWEDSLDFQPGTRESGVPSAYFGEGVTDLAYHRSFEVESQALGASLGDFGNEEFAATDVDKAMAMLKKDEEAFEEDNMFMQEEVMEVMKGLQSSLSVTSDSWMLQHTHDSLSSPSWLQAGDSWEQGMGSMRMSIGALIAAKTEVLGSLSGRCASQRPTFGTDFATPPRDRLPVALIDDSNCQTEPEMKGVDEEADASPDATLVLSDLSHQSSEGPTATPPHGKPMADPEDVVLTASVTHMTSFVGDDSRPSSPQSNVSNSSSDDSVGGLLSISTITDLINKAKPEEENLAGLIIQMSHGKQSRKGLKPATGVNIAAKGVKPTMNDNIGKGLKPTTDVDIGKEVKPTMNVKVGRGVKRTTDVNVSGKGAKPTTDVNVSGKGAKPTTDVNVAGKGAKSTVDVGAEEGNSQMSTDCLVQGVKTVNRECSIGQSAGLRAESERLNTAQLVGAEDLGEAEVQSARGRTGHEGEATTRQGCGKTSRSGLPVFIGNSEGRGPKGKELEKKASISWKSDIPCSRSIGGQRSSQESSQGLCQKVEGHLPSRLNSNLPVLCFQRPCKRWEASNVDHQESYQPQMVRESSSLSQGQSKPGYLNKHEKLPPIVTEPAPSIDEWNESERSSQAQLRVDHVLTSTQDQKAKHPHLENSTQSSIDPVKGSAMPGTPAPEKSGSASLQGGGKVGSQPLPVAPPLGSLDTAHYDNMDFQSVHHTGSCGSSFRQKEKPPHMERELTPQKLSKENIAGSRAHKRMSSTPNDAGGTFDPTSATSSPQGVSLITSSLSKLNTFETLTSATSSMPSLHENDKAMELQRSVVAAEEKSSMDDVDMETLPPPSEKEKTNSSEMASSGAPVLRHSMDTSAASMPAVTSGLQVAAEWRLAKQCCVGLAGEGILEVTNASSEWLQIVLHLASITIDGQRTETEGCVPFAMKEKVILEPQSKEDIKIVFSPKQPGIHIGQLHLMASIIGCPSWSHYPRVPSMVTLQAVAALPNIQVTSTTSNMLDFGTVTWDFPVKLEVSLFNRGQCAVSVQLRIASSSGCFSFETKCEKHCSSVELNLLPNEGTPTQVQVRFCAPSHPDRKTQGLLVQSQPELFQGQLEVETPVSCTSVLMRALVGVAKLHTPRSMEVVELSAAIGQLDTKQMPLRNAGNIPLLLSFEISEWPELFAVQPQQLSIPPQQECHVSVQFSPKQHHVQHMSQNFESLLLVHAGPTGAGYEFDLCGRVLTPPKSPELLSNKHILVFGGVALGKASQQSFTLNNPAPEAVTLTLAVSGHCSDFMVLSPLQNKLLQTHEIVLKPHESHTAHVIFTPSRTAGMQGKLYIVSSHSSRKFSIPLVGYGGRSQLELQGVEMGAQQQHYWTDVGPFSPGEVKVIDQMKLVNTGTRAAFVKVVPFRDLSLQEPLGPNCLISRPDRFCIQPAQALNLSLTLRLGEKELSAGHQGASVIAVAAIVYGDEVCRRKMRSSLHKTGRCNYDSHSTDSVIKGMDFDVRYLFEDMADVGADIPSSLRDIDVFYSSMSKVLLSVVGQPVLQPAPAPGGCGPPLKDVVRSMSCVDSTGSSVYGHQAASLPTRGSPTPHCEPFVGKPSRAEQFPVSWNLQPEQLILEPPKPGAGTLPKKMVQLINYKDSSVSYEVSTPSYVEVFPEKGVIGPMSSFGLAVGASSKVFDEGLELPYQGNVLVTCNAQKKVLPVQIHQDLVLDRGRLTASAERVLQPLSSQTPLVTISTPQRPSRQVSVTRQELDFGDTALRQTIQLPLELTNIRPVPVKWTVSSIAPPYRKAGNGDNSVYRVTYSAFWLSAQSGVLQAQQATQIEVFFSPRELGSYSQGWDVQTEMLEGGATTTYVCRLCVTGQGIDHRSGGMLRVALDVGATSKETSQQHQSSGYRPQHAVTGKPLIVATPQKVIFPATLLADRHVCTVKIKNMDINPHEVHVVNVTQPFHVTHTSVTLRPVRFVQLPITFRPRKEGNHTGVLALQTDNGNRIEVKLQGLAERGST